MPAPGYSGTPLSQKLGIRPGMKILLYEAPAAYSDWLEMDISKQLCRNNDIPDLVHLFAINKKAYESQMNKLRVAARKNTAMIVWVSWYKKSSKIETDLTEDGIRDYALQNGWVDIKVCAVSEQWSGLKLVIPVKNR